MQTLISRLIDAATKHGDGELADLLHAAADQLGTQEDIINDRDSHIEDLKKERDADKEEFALELELLQELLDEVRGLERKARDMTAEQLRAALRDIRIDVLKDKKIMRIIP